MMRAGTAGKAAFLSAALLCARADAPATILEVQQKYQEKTQWCWAGCSQAILEYYSASATQTEIAAYGTPGTDNTWNYLFDSPEVPTRRGIDSILDYFGGIATTGSYRDFTRAKVTSEIDAGRPFVVRWGWAPNYDDTGHFVVARGIEGDTVYLMDPWFGPTINTYSWVVLGSNHKWTHTLALDTDPVPTATPTITPTPTVTPTPTPWTFPKKVNYQPAAAATPSGFAPDFDDLYDEGRTYGWL